MKTSKAKRGKPVDIIVKSARQARAMWPKDAVAIVTADTKVTICAPKPDPRSSNTYSESP